MFATAFTLVLSLGLLWPAPPADAGALNNCGNGILNREEECDDGNISSDDGCSVICKVKDGWTCSGQPSVCTPTGATCGNGVIETVEACDDGNSISGDGCQNDCSVQPGFECIGQPSVCLPGQPTVDCGNGIVDEGEDCDGGACCVDCEFGTATTTCRASAGGCDPAEVCSGSSALCPADSKRASTFVCRAAAGSCDVAERCDGASNTCPSDTVSAGATVCRPAVSPACDVAESCTGTSGACPADVLVNCPDVDGIDCVHPACDVSGQCTTQDDCHEVCRQPKFWSMRAGTPKRGEGVIASILEDVGSISVCGRTIDSADDVGNLGSVLEALCVRTQGVEERELFQQLVTTALNCAVSEGGTCDQILSSSIEVSFNACDALCAGTPVPGGPTVDECIDQLSCFNRGGQTFDGDCARGTCEDDPTELCGADFGSCSGIDGDHDGDDDDADSVSAAMRGAHSASHKSGPSGNKGNGTGDDDDGDNDDGDNDDGDDNDADDVDCQPFPGNCADARLCNSDSDAPSQVCPRRTTPTAQRACQQARKNDCTIDNCD